MLPNWFRIAVAAGSGAVIGTAIMQYYALPYALTLLGMGIGAIAGWVLCAPIAFARDVRDAALATIIPITAWSQLPAIARRAALWEGAFLLSLFTSVSLMAGGSIALLEQNLFRTILTTLLFSVLGLTCFVGGTCQELMRLDRARRENKLSPRECRHSIRFSKQWTFWASPIGIVAFAVLATIGAVLHIPDGLRAIGRFAKLAARWTTCDMRMASAFGAAAGVLAGYPLGDLFVSGAVGLATGLLCHGVCLLFPSEEDCGI